MSRSPENADILEDEALAPLKRNHACLQCKKRKVKCDATRPTCSPCLRSHAHALRTAQRNKSTPPRLVCTYADVSPMGSEDEGEVAMDGVEANGRRSGPNEVGRKRGGAAGSKPSRAVLSGRNLEREKEMRRDEEKETLLARIAELEGRLSRLDANEPSHPQGQMPQSQAGSSNKTSPDFIDTLTTDPAFNVGNSSTQAWVEDVTGVGGRDQLDDEFDINGLFVIPSNWPKNLPLPFLLEHLIESFFAHAPLLPRMLHRPTLLSRIRLAPTSPDFPHPSLLHAICAYGSMYTAWVTSLKPEALEAAVESHIMLNGSLDAIDDFGLAQGEAAQKAILFTSHTCMMGPGTMWIEICQANIILADLYFNKGLPMVGWIHAGNPARLIKALEMQNKNRPHRYKEPLVAEATTAIQREERIATVWVAFVQDAGFSINSCWSGSMDLPEIRCPLPVSAEIFNSRDSSVISENPQSAESQNMLHEHPVVDSFVLAVKASTLVWRLAKWVRDWQQRDVVAGDDLDALQTPEYHSLVNDIYLFQSSIPHGMRNLYKILDASSPAMCDSNFLMIHIIPNVALCLIHEPFVDWQSDTTVCLDLMQRGYEAVLGVLHLIPSNLDVSLIMNSTLTYSLFNIGRIVANFVQRAMERQQYNQAVRYRADVQTIQNVIMRYGQKHSLGQTMSQMLDAYLIFNSIMDINPNDVVDRRARGAITMDQIMKINEMHRGKLRDTSISKAITHLNLQTKPDPPTIQALYAKGNVGVNTNSNAKSNSNACSTSQNLTPNSSDSPSSGRSALTAPTVTPPEDIFYTTQNNGMSSKPGTPNDMFDFSTLGGSGFEMGGQLNLGLDMSGLNQHQYQHQQQQQAPLPQTMSQLMSNGLGTMSDFMLAQAQTSHDGSQRGQSGLPPDYVPGTSTMNQWNIRKVTEDATGIVWMGQ